MSRKRPPPDPPSPRDLPEDLNEWAVPPGLYYDRFMPDDSELLQNMHVPSMGSEAAYARIKDVCAGIQALINIVPTYLPLDGVPHQRPQLDGAGTKPLVDECFRRINLTTGEWVALWKVLPGSAVTALQTLARTIDDIWRRWGKAEMEYGLFGARAYLAKKRGEKLPDEIPAPLRSIREQELTWLKQALAIVEEAVDAEHTRKTQITEPKRKRGYDQKSLTGG